MKSHSFAAGSLSRASGSGSTPQERAHQLASNRRDFLRTAAGLALGGTLFLARARWSAPRSPPENEKWW